MKESTCYFSYSWDDIDSKVLEEIKIRVKERSYNNVNVIYDKDSFSFAEKVSENMKRLKSSDSVVVFFTPTYKKKVFVGDVKRGVTQEYNLIKERLKNNDECVIPVLAKGSKEESITEEFDDIWYCDISKFTYKQSLKRNGRIIFTKKEWEEKIDSLVSCIIQKSDDAVRLKNIDFENLEEEYQTLFFDLADNKKLPSECLIKVEAYEAILKQTAYFVVGRKGSGKSTLLNVIENYNREAFQKNYKTLCPISAESINLNYVYKIIVEENEQDLKVLSLAHLLRTFWGLFLALQSVYIVCLEEEAEHISDERRKVIKRVSNKMRKHLKISGSFDQENVRASIFTLSTELFENHLKNGIFDPSSADEKTVITSISNNITILKILENFFGKNLLVNYCEAISKCKKKIILALDGFDIDSEEFRRDTSQLKEFISEREYNNRQKFETYFYRDLLETVVKIKKQKFGNCIDKLFSKIDFCIILPQDRLDQIRQVDRDSIKKNFCYLNWDAHDLLEMLVLRLERFYNVQSQSTNMKARYETIIRKQLPQIPLTINVNIKTFPKQFNLFNYILRLSFWRPRDVLRNFAIILKLSKSYTEDEIISESLIKQKLANSAHKILMEEFIKEYENVYYNLENVLHCFDSKDLIIPIDEFNQMLGKIKIDSANSDEDLSSPKDKLTLLYKLGVVGLYFDKNIVEKSSYGHYMCFIFNEGLQPFERVIGIGSDKTKLSVIFNPIFCKFLSLNMNTDDLIGEFDWNYIVNNHRRKDIIKRI